ncbi:bacterioferritin-associated ferredoxin, partial [Pseudomonas aeruginosa]|uniref:(2Fe-2S)-binding protein n=1 Tax=Pseudomonas aeruginosa TaxID=287 RepID=UPI001D0AE553
QPPLPTPVRGRQVCTCFNVSTTDIEAVLPRCSGDAAERLQQLQAALKCGTNCGSCIPELKRLVAAPVTA